MYNYMRRVYRIYDPIWDKYEVHRVWHKGDKYYAKIDDYPRQEIGESRFYEYIEHGGKEDAWDWLFAQPFN